MTTRILPPETPEERKAKDEAILRRFQQLKKTPTPTPEEDVESNRDPARDSDYLPGQVLTRMNGETLEDFRQRVSETMRSS